MTREVMQQALVTLENVNPSLVCEMAHHPKKDQHGVGQKCPLEIRHLETIAAIKEVLAQPVQEQENPSLIEWKEQGEEIMAQAGIGFHLGAWWADRPWRQR